MNNEIKEILDKLNNINNYDYSETCDNKNNVIEKEYDIYLSKKETDLLLDYITNLQQENKRLEKQLEYLRTDEYLNQIKWERNFNETMNKELKTRIKKAVEYIENTPLYETTYDYNMEEELEIQNVSDETASNDLLNILNGRSDE